MRAYIGGATSGQGSTAKGIVIADIDGPHISEAGRGAETTGDPMYQALSASGDRLYTVHERSTGSVSAWAVEGTTLRALGQPRSSGGSGPCHLSLHPDGEFLLVANYSSGEMAVLPVLDDGSLGDPVTRIALTGSGPVADRQASAHAHQVIVDPVDGPARGHVLLTDLGGDRVYRYLMDPSTGALEEVDVAVLPPGSGPRHLVVNGQFAYVAGELDSTVSVLDLTTSPPSVVASTSTIDRSERPDVKSQPSAIRLGTDRRFLYVANRFVNEIAVLAIDGAEVTLVGTAPCGGDHPRDIEVSPDGTHLFSANQWGDNVVSFAIDAETGLLTATGDVYPTGSPSSIVFAPA